MNRKTDDDSMGKRIVACIVSLNYNETKLFEDLQLAVTRESTGLNLSDDFDMFFEDGENEWVRIRNNQSLLGFLEGMDGPIFKLTACFQNSKKEKQGISNTTNLI